MVRSCLKCGADHEDEAEAHQGVESAELLVDEGGGDGAEEGSCCEERNNVRGDVGVL